MSNPTCTAAVLVEQNACLSQALFMPREQKCLKIYFNILELAALGGTDYSSVVASTLITDAVALADTMNLAQRETALLAIQRNNAVAAGASVPTDPSQLKDGIKCFEDYPDLDALVILLQCKLGVHKAYPQ